mmetsp:Transcript_9092/g.41363  ORF Transcript_9092/g.41363 Transcript_9092/m.41363 type:complete len:235 (+) Transcript_9092:1733-2437(+)
MPASSRPFSRSSGLSAIAVPSLAAAAAAAPRRGELLVVRLPHHRQKFIALLQRQRQPVAIHRVHHHPQRKPFRLDPVRPDGLGDEIRLRQIVLPRPGVNLNRRPPRAAHRAVHGVHQRTPKRSHPPRAPPGSYRRRYQVNLGAKREGVIRGVGEEKRRARAHRIPEVQHPRVPSGDGGHPLAPRSLRRVVRATSLAVVPRPRGVRDVQDVIAGGGGVHRGGCLRPRAPRAVLPA